MSLLDCICCPEHKNRTAVFSDDLNISSAETYSCIVERSCLIACYLRRKLYGFSGQGSPDMVVGVVSESCPEVVSAVLGILAVPAVFMPLNTGQIWEEMMEKLMKHEVLMILVHHSNIQEFLDVMSCDCHVILDTTVLELGFLTVVLKTPLTVFSPTAYSDITTSLSLSSFHCTLIETCTECSHCLRMNSSFSCLSLLPSLATYTDDTQQLFSCKLCQTNSINRTNDISNKRDTDDTKYSNTNRWSFPHISPLSLSYIIHTSGTTGPPKPVRVTHCCIVPNIIDLSCRFSVSPDDTIFNAAPLTFDPSIVEIFLALYSGASLLMVETGIKRLPWKLAEVLFHRNPVSVLQITPSLFHRFPEHEVRERLLGNRSRVRILAFGGEQFPSLKHLSDLISDENETKIFNIYGTTEVSSWSTCYRLTSAEFKRAKTREVVEDKEEGVIVNGVPIGEPLLGTIVQVRDTLGRIISQGSGEIFLGGEYRVCILGDETGPTHSTMRGTGDSGYVDENGAVYCMGRVDRQVKRLGHRISLDQVEQTIESRGEVKSCAVTAVSDPQTLQRLFPSSSHQIRGDYHRLVAFTVVTHSLSKPSLNPSRVGDSPLAALARCLPSHMLPDVIIPVNYLPCNSNGKVDLEKLLRFDPDPSLYLTQSALETNLNSSIITKNEIESDLLSILSEFTVFSEWPADSTLVDVGLTSFDIVRVADAIGRHFKILTLPLTDILLTESFSRVVDLLWEELCDGVIDDERKMSRGGDVKTEPHRKRERDETYEFSQPQKIAKSDMIITSRRGKIYINGKSVVAMSERVQCMEKRSAIEMKVKWSYNTGRCVDASPLVVTRNKAPPTVFTGSHSGVFVAIDSLLGRALWRAQLSDRIESSAALTPDFAHVVVGCYDGCIYCLKIENGEVKWRVTLSCEPVKSSPCSDVSTGLVWVGSHDHHLYAISGARGVVVMKVFIDGGSCFSSPCLDCQRDVVYTATLGGTLAALDKNDGHIVWMYDGGRGRGGGKPFFSSPCVLPSGDIAIGSVDGCIHIVDSSGKLVRLLKTENALFSSPSVVAMIGSRSPVNSPSVRDEEGGVDMEGETERVLLLCGSHDKHVHCWDKSNGVSLWKTPLDSEVYSTPTPSVLSLSTTIQHHSSKETPSTLQDTLTLYSTVCVASSAGVVYILDLITGETRGSLKLPGQIFSSPVMVDNMVLVGCRDNYIYCIECDLY